MWPFVYALAVLALFAVFVSYLFLKDIIIVVVNVALLYLSGLKIHADLTKRNLFKEYGITAVFFVIILLLIGNFLPIWFLTSVVLLSTLAVQTYLFWKTRKKSKS